jgi:hypothetical protein
VWLYGVKRSVSPPSRAHGAAIGARRIFGVGHNIDRPNARNVRRSARIRVHISGRTPIQRAV